MISDLPEPPAIVVRVPSREIDLEALCWAIEEREGGKWSSPGGRACWTKRAWMEETGGKLSYALASKPAVSRYFAALRLAKFALRFRRDGIDPTAWRLAASWNLGYNGARRAVRGLHPYSEHVEALYEKRLGR